MVSEFLSYWLRSTWFVDEVCARSVGVSYPATNASEVGSLPVAIPPLPTQRAIADFLDRKTAAIDALIEKKQKLLDLLAEKRTALINRAVTKGLDPGVPMKDSGVPWIGEIPAHWDCVAMKQLTRPGTTITYGIVQAGPDIENGVPYIRVSEMSGEFLPESGFLRTSPEIDRSYSRSRVYPGDVVIALRASIGKALKVPDSLPHANLTQGTAKFSSGPRLDPEYTLWALNSAASYAGLEVYAKGATFREITLEALRNHRIPLPPLSDQRTITRFLDARVGSVDAIRRVAEVQIRRLAEYRQALITAAVTGQIDVEGA